MPQKKFTIISVTVSNQTDTDICKALQSGGYTFNNANDVEGKAGFFGDNITVSTIVGKNGCDKSMLIQLYHC